MSRLSGLYPAAVICEIMNDDGTMARVPDLIPFAQRHGLKIGTIEDLISYRIQHDKIVKRVAENNNAMSAYGGEFQLRVYAVAGDPTEHMALVKGDLSQGGPVLVRVHALNIWQDVLGINATDSRRSLVQKCDGDDLRRRARRRRAGAQHAPRFDLGCRQAGRR